MSRPDYYHRQAFVNTDGSPLFCQDYDKENEQEVVAELSRGWKCEIKPFGRLCPIDYFAIKDGRMAGLVEIKSRTHPSTKYDDVFLNLRKWSALAQAQAAFGCPAVFVVKFTDKIMFIRLFDIDTRGAIEIRGCREIVKSHSDREPVILVKIENMSELKHLPAGGDYA